MVCSNFIEAQLTTTATVLPRVHSDNSPLILKPSLNDFGPYLFHFFNYWLLKADLNKEFDEAWSSFRGYENPDFFIKAKLKFVKDKIRKWKFEDSPKESGTLSMLSDKVNEMGRISQNRPLSELERSSWWEDKLKLLEPEHMAKLDLQQKSKIRWIMDGDDKSIFFHGSLKNTSRKNKIHGLTINGTWTTRPILIKQEVFQFFFDNFKERCSIRLLMINSLSKQLSTQQRQSLKLPISPVEIKKRRLVLWK